MKTAYTGMSRVVVGMVLGTMLYAGIALAEQSWNYCNNTAPVYGLFWIHYEGEGQGRVEHRLTFDDPEIFTKEGETDTNYFDPNKPSIIYIHGYQTSKPYAGIEWNIEPTPLENQVQGPYSGDSFGLGWMKNYGVEGYNVAVFDWKAFTASFSAWDVQNRVWIENGALDFCGCCISPWICFSGSSGINQSISQIFAEKYRELALHNVNHKSVWIIAHSMGTQVALHGAKIAQQTYPEDVKDEDLPSSITLIEPGMMGKDILHPSEPNEFVDEFVGAAIGMWNGGVWDPGLIDYVDRFFWCRSFSIVKSTKPQTPWWHNALRQVIQNIDNTRWAYKVFSSDTYEDPDAHLKAVDWYFRSIGVYYPPCDGFHVICSQGTNYDYQWRFLDQCYYGCHVPATGPIYPLICQ